MPIKIIEEEKEGHRKVKTKGLKKKPKRKSDIYGTTTYKYQSGGKVTRGYGKAYMKGGRAK